MTALTFDAVDERRYESGVSHGVLYPAEGPGVVWNGLISVDEKLVGGDHSEHFLDGVKMLDVVKNRDFQAVVGAFGAPDDFRPLEGRKRFGPGFSITGQPRPRFNFTYRSWSEDSYRIHMVFNILATPGPRGHETLSNAPSPTNLSWTFDASPVAVPGLRPTGHVYVDSARTDSDILELIEEYLYGSDAIDPQFPTLENLVSIFLIGED